MDNPNKTQLAILVEGIRKWRKHLNITSNEAIADIIVNAHYAHGFDITTGITFMMDGKDEYHRQHMNAQKIFRWLDGQTKATNMLNVNFVPSILVDMPPEIKQQTVNALLQPIGFLGRPIPTEQAPESPLLLVKNIFANTAKVNESYANLLDGIDPGEIEDAINKTSMAINQLVSTKASLLAMQKKYGG